MGQIDTIVTTSGSPGHQNMSYKYISRRGAADNKTQSPENVSLLTVIVTDTTQITPITDKSLAQAPSPHRVNLSIWSKGRLCFITFVREGIWAHVS